MPVDLGSAADAREVEMRARRCPGRLEALEEQAQWHAGRAL